VKSKFIVLPLLMGVIGGIVQFWDYPFVLKLMMVYFTTYVFLSVTLSGFTRPVYGFSATLCLLIGFSYSTHHTDRSVLQGLILLVVGITMIVGKIGTRQNIENANPSIVIPNNVALLIISISVAIGVSLGLMVSLSVLNFSFR
jgi:hypothetical protein